VQKATPAGSRWSAGDRTIRRWPMSSPTGKKFGTVGIRIIMTKEANRAPEDPGLDRMCRAAPRRFRRARFGRLVAAAVHRGCRGACGARVPGRPAGGRAGSARRPGPWRVRSAVAPPAAPVPFAVKHDFRSTSCSGNLDAATALIGRHPDTRFVVDHLAILQPNEPPPGAIPGPTSKVLELPSARTR